MGVNVRPVTTPTSSPPPSEPAPPPAIDELVRAFREHVRRALDAPLPADPAALAVVDHYLSLARKESRAPILALLSAEAGAFFGELVRRNLGARWLGDGADPRRLRVLLTHRFCHFSPVDLATAAILGEDPPPDDPRLPPGPPLDLAFHLRKGDEPEEDEAGWVAARLAELRPVPADEYHGLTCRYETLELILQMLAARDAAASRPPRTWGVEDYLAALAGT